MNFDDYQKFAREDAVHPLVWLYTECELPFSDPSYAPLRNVRWIYCVLGFAGELGELHYAVEHSNQDEIVSECGDVLWYICAVLDTRAVPFSSVVWQAQRMGYGDKLYRSDLRDIGLRAAELAKKTLRDQNGTMSVDMWKDLFARAVGSVGFELERIDKTLTDALQGNLRKLRERKTKMRAAELRGGK